MPAPPAPAAPPARRPHPALIGGGVLVVALGFGLPRLLSDPVGPAAAATPPTDPAATPAGPGIGAALARLAAGVVVAGGLCAAAARYAGRRAAAGAGPMTVVGSIRVDARCVVHYVRAGDRRLLIGTDPGGAKALVELPRAAAAEPDDPAEAPSAGAADTEPTPAPDAATVLFARVMADYPAARLAAAAPTPHGGGP